MCSKYRSLIFIGAIWLIKWCQFNLMRYLNKAITDTFGSYTGTYLMVLWSNFIFSYVTFRTPRKHITYSFELTLMWKSNWILSHRKSIFITLCAEQGHKLLIKENNFMNKFIVIVHYPLQASGINRFNVFPVKNNMRSAVNFVPDLKTVTLPWCSFSIWQLCI